MILIKAFLMVLNGMESSTHGSEKKGVNYIHTVDVSTDEKLTHETDHMALTITFKLIWFNIFSSLMWVFIIKTVSKSVTKRVRQSLVNIKDKRKDNA